MIDLGFNVRGLSMLPFAATPQLVLELEIRADRPVHSIMLQGQLRVDVAERDYNDATLERLQDAFGLPDCWGRMMTSLQWTRLHRVVPAFENSTRVEMLLPCSYDFGLAITKYFDALDEGDIPMTMALSGTVLHGPGREVSPVPLDKEVKFELPLHLWQETVHHYYPNCVWICLNKEVFDQFHTFKRLSGSPSWDQALTRLLGLEEEVPS
jgi:hypothetical protein